MEISIGNVTCTNHVGEMCGSAGDVSVVDRYVQLSHGYPVVCIKWSFVSPQDDTLNLLSPRSKV